MHTRIHIKENLTFLRWWWNVQPMIRWWWHNNDVGAHGCTILKITVTHRHGWSSSLHRWHARLHATATSILIRIRSNAWCPSQNWEKRQFYNINSEKIQWWPPSRMEGVWLLAHFHKASMSLTSPVSFGRSRPLINLRFITDTNSLLLSSPSSTIQR